MCFHGGRLVSSYLSSPLISQEVWTLSPPLSKGKYKSGHLFHKKTTNCFSWTEKLQNKNYRLNLKERSDSLQMGPAGFVVATDIYIMLSHLIKSKHLNGFFNWLICHSASSKINITERNQCCSDMRRKIKWNSLYPPKEFNHIPITKCVIKLDTDQVSHCLEQSGGFKLPTGFSQRMQKLVLFQLV